MPNLCTCHHWGRDHVALGCTKCHCAIFQEDRQESLFDGEQSERLKVWGMARAESNHGDRLTIARTLARQHARWNGGEVTSDDVGRLLEKHGLDGNLGAAAGSLFRGDEWVFTGRRVKSTRVTNHGREIKVWRLK
jgi:hypothetical protein